MSPALQLALDEYQTAWKGRWRPGTAVWIDDYQRRERRFWAAVNTLLAVAAEEDWRQDAELLRRS